MATRVLRGDRDGQRFKRVYSYFRATKDTEAFRRVYQHFRQSPIFDTETIVLDPIPFIVFGVGGGLYLLDMLSLTGSTFPVDTTSLNIIGTWVFDDTSGSMTTYPGSIVVPTGGSGRYTSTNGSTLWLLHPETGELIATPYVGPNYTGGGVTFSQSPFLTLPEQELQLYIDHGNGIQNPLFSVLDFKKGAFGLTRTVWRSDLSVANVGGAFDFCYIFDNKLYAINFDDTFVEVDISNPLTATLPTRVYPEAISTSSNFALKHFTHVLNPTKNRDQLLAGGSWGTNGVTSGMWLVDRLTTNTIIRKQLGTGSQGGEGVAYDPINDRFWAVSRGELFVLDENYNTLTSSVLFGGNLDEGCIVYQEKETGTYGTIPARVIVRRNDTSNIFLRFYDPDTMQLSSTLNITSNQPTVEHVTFHDFAPGLETFVANRNKSYIENFDWSTHVFWHDRYNPFMTQSIFARYTSDNVVLGELSGSSGSLDYYYVNQINDSSGADRHLVPVDNTKRCVWVSGSSIFGDKNAIVFRRQDQTQYVMTGTNVTFADLLYNEYELALSQSSTYFVESMATASHASVLNTAGATRNQWGVSACLSMIGSASSYSVTPKYWAEDVLFGMIATGSGGVDTDTGWFVSKSKLGVNDRDDRIHVGYVVTGSQSFSSLTWLTGSQSRAHGFSSYKGQVSYTHYLRGNMTETTFGTTNYPSITFAQTASFQIGKVGRGSFVNFALAELVLTRRMFNIRVADMVHNRYYKTKYNAT